jgi:osmoprotectant transport system substrate-binding protein
MAAAASTGEWVSGGKRWLAGLDRAEPMVTRDDGGSDALVSSPTVTRKVQPMSGSSLPRGQAGDSTPTLTRRAFGGLVGVAAIGLTAAACGGKSNGSSPLGNSATSSPAPSGELVIGSANFYEDTLLAEIYALALQNKGVKVKTKLNIGSRETYFAGLKDGSIDLMPEYTGALLLYLNPKSNAVTPTQVYSALKKELPSKLELLKMSPAQDSDSVVVTKQTAEKYHLKSIADLKPVAGQLVLGGPPEWKTRETGVPGLKKKYGVVFKSFKPEDEAGPLTKNALKHGVIDAANIFSTDPDIVKYGWVVLADPKHMLPASNVVPIINSGKLTDTISKTLDDISTRMDTDTLRSLDAKIVNDKQDPKSVAENWLSKG